MIKSQSEIIEKIWQEKREERQRLLSDFNSSLAINEDLVDPLEVDDYWRKNYWYLTSSKFKCFMNCSLEYYMKYELLLPEPFKKDWKHFTLWTAFDRLRTLTLENWMEEWSSQFMSEYFVMMAKVKWDFIDALLDRWYTESDLKWLKVDELRSLYTWWSDKIKLTVNDWNKLMMMIKETERNKDALDLEWWFENQKYFESERVGNDESTPVKIAWTLDRYRPWTIRDWKSTSRLERILKFVDKENLYQELEKIMDDYWYYYQLWFYWLLTANADERNKTADMYIDFISTESPFNSFIMKIKSDKVLKLINTFILPWLAQYQTALRTWDWTTDAYTFAQSKYYMYGGQPLSSVREL